MIRDPLIAVQHASRVIILALLPTVYASGQTTQGLISGYVVNVRDRSAIEGAKVSYSRLTTTTSGEAKTTKSGYFVFPLLAPGTYQLRVSAPGYQAQELHELELPVAAFLQVTFPLRPLNDVWEQGQYRSVMLPGRSVLVFFGPDLDTSRTGYFEPTPGTVRPLESTVSQVIEPVDVQYLPLAGQDVYTLLVTQPGVTSDATTARGLGLSINGQRPSASTFSLDGLENNNYLTTGPLLAVAPEAVQEYRISTNNFSAEYGRTSGVVANAVTRAGTNQWHGLAYFYLKNDALNANEFQRNLQGWPRAPVKETEQGFTLGGPLRSGLFASGAFDYRRFRSVAGQDFFALPASQFFMTAPDSPARRLLARYPAVAVPAADGLAAETPLTPLSSLDRYLAVPRVDYERKGGTRRFMGRLTLARLHQPDLIWTPYQDFSTPLYQNSLGLALAYIVSTPRLTSETRSGLSFDDLGFERPHPEIPDLRTSDAVLPGSSPFSYRNRGRNIELAQNLLWTRGKHIMKLGGGALRRRLDGFLSAAPIVAFKDFASFAAGQPNVVYVPLSRAGLPDTNTVPRFDREYAYNQFFGFAQDSFKASRRLVFNLGVRYDSFGTPVNTGAVKDTVVALGSGASLPGRIQTAHLEFPNSGDQALYPPDRNDWAARFGFSYSVRQNAQTLLRGAYGLFYDRPFDNLWQGLRNNNFTLASATISGPRPEYLDPLPALLPQLPGLTPLSNFPNLTLYQDNIRTPYSQSYFLGIQHRLRDSWTLEVNGLGSLARKLITTDVINRDLTVRPTLANRFGRLNPDLTSIRYRANQGASDYNALTVVGRYRSAHGQLHIAYTWSHTIDNQSEPLTGDFVDLKLTRPTADENRGGVSTFSNQFDSRADRGNADFDQRHNLVFYSVWQLPALYAFSWAAPLFRNWTFGQVAAFRSGFPFTVFSAPTGNILLGQPIINHRADLTDPSQISNGEPVTGGKMLLNPAGFGPPDVSRIGGTARNAFAGPGLYNIDVSVSRSLGLRWLGESGRLTLRADAFNLLNHANLNNPSAVLGSADFGIAQYGRKGITTGFPTLVPFNETARQIQLMLRIAF